MNFIDNAPDLTLIAITTSLLLIEYLIFTVMTGFARGKGNVQAPAVSGNEHYERMLRVQQNTLEQLIIVIPSLWIFGIFVHGKEVEVTVVNLVNEVQNYPSLQQEKFVA